MLHDAKMQIVPDTNMVISGLMWQGTPRKLIEAFRDQRLVLATSPTLLAELAEVLSRDKFALRLQKARLSARELVEDYRRLARVIGAPPLPEPVCRDPDDDAVLACALAAQADMIVSGDNDLLTLEQFQGIPILTPAKALQQLR